MNKKTALITGAASGIGLAIAANLARQGHSVCLTDVNKEAVQQAAEVLRQERLDVFAQPLDVTSDTAIDAVVTAVAKRTGAIDILINNAGLQHVSRLEDFPVDRWRLLIEVLLVGPSMLTRAVLPLMREHNYGRIINIGSIHSLVASPHKSAYVAAKHGLLGFSKTVALETADQDITINTICPAYVKTPLVEQQIANQAKEYGISEQDVINKIMLEPMPKKSFIAMDELEGAVNYLIDNVSRNITGQQLVLDGGWTAK
ncbi:3-hydroxybutyrate dehydrogenase [Pseudomaricurvus alcaniphilus]|uniref:3-hydroxybutyrate dehydrogenase n=1 Tax=Pseudomaricurvus alcaniphilus TaxID=1166482 RepID=UPI00140B1B4D|nr:3-hydroxybutyrate dehydrogenase [Pseudomaricurvus alcaniphilus]NHN37879.1 3-hydroxybutyrate dehydrogenase [Pseudomaricurvus alcaniphilus]